LIGFVDSGEAYANEFLGKGIPEECSIGHLWPSKEKIWFAQQAFAPDHLPLGFSEVICLHRHL